MYPENPEGTQVMVGSMNVGYISDIARNRPHNLFRPKWEPIPLGYSDSSLLQTVISFNKNSFENLCFKSNCIHWVIEVGNKFDLLFIRGTNLICIHIFPRLQVNQLFDAQDHLEK